MRRVLHCVLTRWWRGPLIVLGGLLLIGAILYDHGCNPTGFGACTPLGGELRPEKTLWDWMDLLIVPAVLAIVGLIFTRQERADERAIADKRTQDETLRTYLDQMTELLLYKGLRTSQIGAEVRDVARVRTLIALRRLDQERRAIVIQFLRDSKLVGLNDEEKIVKFDGADLSRANLSNNNLSGISFAKTNLWGADLQGADLRDTDLREASLKRANLNGANLNGARLNKADLEAANLEAANLGQSNLEAAKISDEQLKATLTLFGAILPDGLRYARDKWR